MKKLLLLSLISTPAFANWVSSPTSSAYAEQEICQLKEAAKCYFLDPKIDREITEVKSVDVDDTSKPIYNFQDSKEECSKDNPPVCARVCPETVKDSGIFYEYVENAEFKNDCRWFQGYEKKPEDQMVIDPVKEAAKEADKIAKEAAEVQKKLACDAFMVAVSAMVLSNNPDAAAVATAVKNLLGLAQNCR